MNFAQLAKQYKWIGICVWISRIFVGATFIISGFAKSVDLWGFVYKIEEYLFLWDWSQPRSIVFAVAFLLSGFEFVTGVLLLTGCYRRTVPILLLVTMIFMLPLTAYIWIKDPVADCGCFGDFLIISNGLTFLKNFLLTILIIFLLFLNSKVQGLIAPYIQWLVMTLSIFYVSAIGIVGYNVQPVIDFRSFPEGSNILQEDEGEEDVVEFIYEKNGKEQKFDYNHLPDSTWTYIKRVQQPTPSTSKTEFYVIEDDENIAEEIIDTTSLQLLVIIPEYNRAAPSYSYLINEMDKYISELGGSTIGLIGGNTEDIEEWEDLSMAQYPVYMAEPTLLKELSRGNMSIVLLDKGIIQWKRTASSIDVDLFEDEPSVEFLRNLRFDGKSFLFKITFFYIALILLIFFLDRSGKLIKWRMNMKKRRSQSDNSSSTNK